MTIEKIKQIGQVEEQEQEKGEMKMTEQIEQVEEFEVTGKYIPDNELAESKRIMRGRTLYTINKDLMIV